MITDRVLLHAGSDVAVGLGFDTYAVEDNS